jgi:hypothetical protein
MCVSPNGDGQSDLQEESDRLAEELAESSEQRCAETETKPKRVAYSSEFERFWTTYPRLINKQAAFDVWKARMREGISPDDLIRASKNYAAYCVKNNRGIEYIQHATTFLGKKRPFAEFVAGAPDEANLPRPEPPNGTSPGLSSDQLAEMATLLAEGKLS